MKMINPTLGSDLAGYINEIYGTDIEIWGDSLVDQDWTQYLNPLLNGRVSVKFGFSSKTASYIRDQFISNADISKAQIFWVGRNDYNIDLIIDPIREMVAHLGHDRFLVMVPPNGGYHTEFNTGEKYELFTETERRLQNEYPNNFLNNRKAVIDGWNFGNVRLNTSFIQPAINSNIQVDVTDANFLNTLNPSDEIELSGYGWNYKVRIGLLGAADLYEIISVDSDNLITLKLLEVNVKNTGETVSNEVLFDGGKSYLQVLQELDFQLYHLDTTPSTSRSDSVHLKYPEGRQFIARQAARFINRKFA